MNEMLCYLVFYGSGYGLSYMDVICKVILDVMRPMRNYVTINNLIAHC